jgi:hypothetical protein
MNFDEYFAKRNELTMRVLLDLPESVASRGDARFAAIGGACILAAAGIHVWASRSLVDPGYFSRTSTFLALMLFAGMGILITAQVAEFWLAHFRIRTRELLRERTVSRLITADRFIAQRLAGERD